MMTDKQDEPIFVVKLSGILRQEDIERYARQFNEVLPGYVVVVDNRVEDIKRIRPTLRTTFDEAFFWALWYNGFEEHVDAMIEYINDNGVDIRGDGRRLQVEFPRGKSACVTVDDVVHDNPNSILWMVLVDMFGDYGTSPRYGWIEQPHECVEYLKELRRKTWLNCSGYEHFSEDEAEAERAKDARLWESEQCKQSQND